jgi:hypothetical protein
MFSALALYLWRFRVCPNSPASNGFSHANQLLADQLFTVEPANERFPRAFGGHDPAVMDNGAAVGYRASAAGDSRDGHKIRGFANSLPRFARRGRTTVPEIPRSPGYATCTLRRTAANRGEFNPTITRPIQVAIELF